MYVNYYIINHVIEQVFGFKIISLKPKWCICPISSASRLSNNLSLLDINSFEA